MSGISVHAVDVARGVAAAGLRVEIFALDPHRKLIAEGMLGPNGALEHAIVHTRLDGGAYEVLFHVGEFLKSAGSLGTSRFLNIVPFRFTITDPAQHYHLPLKFTPWGYSVFRGS